MTLDQIRTVYALRQLAEMVESGEVAVESANIEHEIEALSTGLVLRHICTGFDLLTVKLKGKNLRRINMREKLSPHGG